MWGASGDALHRMYSGHLVEDVYSIDTKAVLRIVSEGQGRDDTIKVGDDRLCRNYS